MSLRSERAHSPAAASGLIIALMGALVFVLVLPSTSEAIPAFARQFQAACSMCHSPVPPRLNNVGIVFRRMGYRLPDINDQGKLILKDKPSRGVFEDFSLVGDLRAQSARDEASGFKVEELVALGAGPINEHLSYQAGFSYGDGTLTLETLEGHLIAGRPTANVTVRFGMLKPEIWTKGGNQRLTVFAPLLSSTPVSVGGFAGFALEDAQRGAEVGLNFNHVSDAGARRSTFLSVGVYDGLTQNQDGVQFDRRGFKNVVAQVVHLWGESQSVAALWYHGNAQYGAGSFEDTTDRVTLMGNYQLKSGTDLLAGISFGRDTTNEPEIDRVSSRGWFAEVTQAIGLKTAAIIRYDRFEPDRAIADVRVDGPTIGVTHHLLNNLILNAEYHGLRTGSDLRGRDLVGRIILAY
jgi:hypothetical protein